MRRAYFNVWSALAITLALLGTPLYAQFVYVASQEDIVWGFMIDPLTGALTAVPGSPFAAGAGAGAVSLAVDPNGRFAYVASYYPNTVTGYTINPTTGVLTIVGGSPFATGNSPSSMAVDPSGKFAYVTIPDPDHVWGYTINPDTGALTPIANSPFIAGEAPHSVAVDPSGKFAYVVNLFGNNVSGYSINPVTGALTAITGSPFATGPRTNEPISVAVDPNGKFSYVAILDGTLVSGFTIDPLTGALTAIAGSLFGPVGYSGFSVAVARVKPSVHGVYITNEGSKSVSVINPSTNVVVSTITVGANPVDAALTPNGATPYITNAGADTVSVVNTATNAVTTTVKVGWHPVDAAVTPDGSSVYVTNEV